MQGDYSYNREQMDTLSRTISRDRLQRYISDAGDNEEAGFRRYVLNTLVSEAFYTPLQGLEIAIRHAIHHRATTHFGTDWFGDHTSLLQHPGTEMVEKARQSLTKQNKQSTSGGIVAELSFGFWVSVLGPKYEVNLWRPCLRLAFPNRPRGTERKAIQVALDEIRRLRNRIAHHEPILDRDLHADCATILKILGWICADTAAWVDHHSRTARVLSENQLTQLNTTL